MAEKYSGKVKKWVIGFGVAILLYTVVDFLVLPAIIKSQMLKRLTN